MLEILKGCSPLKVDENSCIYYDYYSLSVKCIYFGIIIFGILLLVPLCLIVFTDNFMKTEIVGVYILSPMGAFLILFYCKIIASQEATKNIVEKIK